jgi:GT2 family glycosyltransferase
VGADGSLESLYVNRVYIIIVNWNGWRDTLECLESLLLLEYSDFRIVVCDNGSKDDSVAKLREWGERKFGSCLWQVLSRTVTENGGGITGTRFTLVVNGENLGFAGGNNVGLRYALSCGDAEYCWILNNDTVVDSFALAAMVERMKERPDAGMCGSTLREYDNRNKIQALGGAVYYKWFGVAWHIGRTISGDVLPNQALVEKKMDYVVGASLLVRSSYLKEVGLMEEDYFLYFEELDWVSRGQGRYSLAYAPKSVVYHKVGASIGTATNPRRKSFQCDFYSLRNRLLFTERYYPSALVGVYACLIGELIIRLLLGRWDLARMVLRLIINGSDASEGRSNIEKAIS